MHDDDNRAAPAPAVTVSLPPALLPLFPSASSRVEICATTVHDLMDALDTRWPGMRDRLCDSSPAIRPNLVVFVDGHRAEIGTLLSAGAEVFIMTRVSGG